MSMPLVLLLVVVTAALNLLRLRRSARVLCVLTVLLTLSVGCGLVPGQMLKRLQVDYPDEGPPAWQARSLIIVLGGGIQQVADGHALQIPSLVYARAGKGLELYLQCKRAGGACTLLISGGDTQHLGASEAQVYAGVLERLGVDPGDIATEGNSLNTWQNAQFCAAWLHEHPQDQVVLVTSGIHVRRSVLYFSHFGVRARGVRADYIAASLSWVPQAADFFLTDLAVHEYSGLARYHIYELFGWNIEARRRGAL
jgi:uncharacterized SAM-binding protein YcdF (DUF218 family)